MKTIIYVSQKDFDRLDNDNFGQILFNEYGYSSLIGGLDHNIEKTKKQCIISDIGCNSICNDYIVRIFAKM